MFTFRIENSAITEVQPLSFGGLEAVSSFLFPPSVDYRDELAARVPQNHFAQGMDDIGSTKKSSTLPFC